MPRLAVVRVVEERNGSKTSARDFANGEFEQYLSTPQTVTEGDCMVTTLWFVVSEPVTNLKKITVMSKMGLVVARKEDIMGTFSPSVDPYEYTFPSSTVPSGLLMRGTYERVTSYVCDEGVVIAPIRRAFTISKK